MLSDALLSADAIVGRAAFEFLPANPDWTTDIEPCCRRMAHDLTPASAETREGVRLRLVALLPTLALPTERILAATFGENGNAPAGEADTRHPSRSLAEILKDPDALKPPSPVAPGLAWRERLTLIAAREGVGKTTLFQAVAAAVTVGGEFLGERCARGVVLWVLVEEHLSDLAIRAVKFQTAPDVFHVLERPTDPLATLRAEVARLQPVLVIIDTLHRFATSIVSDGSTADQWGPLMEALDVIARHGGGPAVLMSAQAIKATGEYRDSTAIGHGVDVVLNLVRPEKDSAVRRLECQKTRWTIPDVQFELDGDVYRRAGAPRVKLSPQRQRVLDSLEPPMTYTEWAEASGVPSTTFKRALKYLTEQRHVRVDGDGTYHRNQGPLPSGPSSDGDRAPAAEGPSGAKTGGPADTSNDATIAEGPLGPNRGHPQNGPEPEVGPPFPCAVKRRVVVPTAGPTPTGPEFPENPPPPHPRHERQPPTEGVCVRCGGPASPWPGPENLCNHCMLEAGRREVEGLD